MARWLGIDVTNTAVRIALLRSGVRRPEVVALREERCSDHESSSAALRTCLIGLKAETSAAAVAGARAFLRRVDIPIAAQRELENVLSFEIEATLPVELDDAVMDHRLLTRGPEDEEAKMLPILAGVAYTHDVRDVINMVRRGTGSEPLRVGIGPMPLANLGQVCLPLSEAPVSAVLDLGDGHADFLVLAAGEPRFARCLSSGAGTLPEGATELMRELKLTLGSWRAKGGALPDKVMLVGGAVEVPGIREFLQNELAIEAIPLPELALDGVTDKTQLPRFAKAIGLALGLARRPLDLNMRQGPLETQQSYQFLREKIPLLAGLTAAVVVSFGFSAFAELRALDTERELLETQLADTTRIELGTETRDPQEAAKLLEDVIAGKTDDPLPKTDGFTVLVELSKRIPEGIIHDIQKFTYKGDKVKIDGIVEKIKHAEEIETKLKEYECFHDVDRVLTSQLKDGKQKYVMEMTVRCGKPVDDKKKKKKKKGAK